MTADVQFVYADPKGVFTSPTLSLAGLQRIQEAYRRVPWYRDRLASATFRREVGQIEAEFAPSGLVFLVGKLPFEVPPAFHEFFEPIELKLVRFASQLADDPMQMLSGEAPTRQERFARVGGYIIVATLAAIFLPIAITLLVGGQYRVLATIFGALAANFALIVLILWLARFAGRWYLIPRGVVIRRSFGLARRRTIVRDRRDTIAMLRYVHTGKSHHLNLDLWSPAGRRWSRPVSEREAISFLAAWQSRREPPTREQLQELTI
ncbi:MAG: hypothetical protein ACKVS9_13925 [Phycisphaerae bacterium]